MSHLGFRDGLDRVLTNASHGSLVNWCIHSSPVELSGLEDQLFVIEWLVGFSGTKSKHREQVGRLLDVDVGVPLSDLHGLFLLVRLRTSSPFHRPIGQVVVIVYRHRHSSFFMKSELEEDVLRVLG
jgi:hypothetical protein